MVTRIIGVYSMHGWPPCSPPFLGLDSGFVFTCSWVIFAELLGVSCGGISWGHTNIFLSLLSTKHILVRQ